MPLDSLAVLVVEDGQTGLVMELLQPLDGDPNVVICRDRPLINALKVVRLRSSLLSAGRPEGVRVGLRDQVKQLQRKNQDRDHGDIFTWLVEGILPLPAPAQNHPLTLIGWR